MSKGFAIFYTGVLIIIGYHAYKLIQERGKTAAGLATIELGKQCLVTAQLNVDKGIWYMQHHKELREDTVAYYEKVKEQVLKISAHFLAAHDDDGQSGQQPSTKPRARSRSPGEKKKQ